MLEIKDARCLIVRAENFMPISAADVLSTFDDITSDDIITSSGNAFVVRFGDTVKIKSPSSGITVHIPFMVGQVSAYLALNAGDEIPRSAFIAGQVELALPL